LSSLNRSPGSIDLELAFSDAIKQALPSLSVGPGRKTHPPIGMVEIKSTNQECLTAIGPRERLKFRALPGSSEALIIR
jgi:hypothetical protein